MISEYLLNSVHERAARGETFGDMVIDELLTEIRALRKVAKAATLLVKMSDIADEDAFEMTGKRYSVQPSWQVKEVLLGPLEAWRKGEQ